MTSDHLYSEYHALQCQTPRAAQSDVRSSKTPGNLRISPLSENCKKVHFDFTFERLMSRAFTKWCWRLSVILCGATKEKTAFSAAFGRVKLKVSDADSVTTLHKSQKRVSDVFFPFLGPLWCQQDWIHWIWSGTQHCKHRRSIIVLQRAANQKKVGLTGGGLKGRCLSQPRRASLDRGKLSHTNCSWTCVPFDANSDPKTTTDTGGLITLQLINQTSWPRPRTRL